MSRKPLTLDNPKHAFIRTIESLTHTKRQWEVFGDFCELSALTLANAVDRFSPAYAKREARFAQIAATYKPEQMKAHSFAFACVVEALEAGYDDVLGSLFMQMDLGSHWHGQFFTPYSIAAMMARMTFDPEQMKGREFITVDEPASGAGGMLIAFAEAVRAAQFNPQTQMHVRATDVDLLCVHMTYIQLSLLNIPAVVTHGNTLTLDRWSCWYTPAHVLGLWGVKLRREQAASAAADAARTIEVESEQLAEVRALLDELPDQMPDQMPDYVPDEQAQSVTTSNDLEQLALF